MSKNGHSGFRKKINSEKCVRNIIEIGEGNELCIRLKERFLLAM